MALVAQVPIRRRVSRLALATLAVVSLGAAALAPLASPAGATAGFLFTRISGADRYDTARQIAVSTFLTSDEVLLATGENFPDALAGSYLAGRLQAPILLTQQANLPQATSEALITLKAKRVTILGGRDAISQTVETSLRSRTSSKDGQPLQVVRIDGNTPLRHRAAHRRRRRCRGRRSARQPPHRRAHDRC